jgi:hypothetical protein
MSVITRTGLDCLRQFVRAGGIAIFVGKTPGLIVDKTFMNAKDVPDLSFATLIEPSGDITARVLAALPKPDVKLDAEFPRLTYTHKAWQDADMYFFFNEGKTAESRTVTLNGRGQAQSWELATAEIRPIAAATADANSVRFPLTLGPYEAKVVVIGPLPANAAAPEPSFATGTTVAELDGDWELNLNGQQLTTPLKPWEDLNTSNFPGPATYRKQFTLAAMPTGKHVYFEIADVHDYARLTLNGNDLDAHAWQPYRWDVTAALKPGPNDLEIEVRQTPAGRRPGAPPAAAVGRGARGGQGGAAPTQAAPPAAGGRAPTPPAPSGLLGPVRLVAR